MARTQNIGSPNGQKRILLTPEENAIEDAKELAWLNGGKAKHEMGILRTERNAKLKESDRTQLLDAPFDAATKGEWVAYRQTLRDLPATTDDPTNPTWPVRPGV